MTLRDLERDAAAGSTVAQTVLGCALVWGDELFGEKLEPNYARALSYLQRAANAGASRAIYHLGVLYEDGLGVPQDLLRAIALHEEAAGSDEYFAVLHVARLYADGRLGYKDAAKAGLWYETLLELAGELGQDPDTDAEIAEAKMFMTTGTLPATAKRARGCP